MSTTADEISAADSLTTLDGPFAQLAGATDRCVSELTRLTARERVFLRVVADTCQQCLGAPFEAHVRDGLARGVTTADIRALLRLIAYDTGYHAAHAALARLAEIETAAGLPAPPAEPLPAELLQTGPGAPPPRSRSRYALSCANSTPASPSISTCSPGCARAPAPGRSASGSGRSRR